MKQVNKMVRVEDFNIDKLRDAFVEGRLYIQSTTAEKSREAGIQAMLRYVSRIDACASEAYQSTIHTLWEKILRSPELGNLFFLERYKNSRGQPNWYRVNATVMALLEHNVYRQDTYTAIQLHLKMEQSTKLTNHYSGMGRYLLNRKELAILLQIIRQ